jgi:hypothetical protein
MPQVPFDVDAYVKEAEARVGDITKRAQEEIEPKLRPANALIAEVKQYMSKGVDLITTTQLQEWAVAIAVINSELVPYKEVFALTKNLWDIETRQISAKNLLEFEAKKTEIDAINKMATTTNAKKAAIAEYIQNMLDGTQEALWMLGNSVRKILDARIAGGDTR